MSQRNYIAILFFLLCQILAWCVGYRHAVGYAYVSPDFESYYLASKVLVNGENPYLLENLAQVKNTNETPFPYLYTPIAAQWVTPLITLQFQQAATLWGLLLISAYGLCMFLAGMFCLRVAERIKIYSQINTWLILTVSLLLGLLFPYIINLQIGQINIFILLLLMIYLLALSENKSFLAGLMLGFCSIIKIVPAFLLLCHLRPDKRFFAGFLAGIISMLGLSMLAFGLTPWAQFAAALPKFSYGTQVEGLWEISAVYNIGFSGTLARILHNEAQPIFIAAIALGIPVLLYFYTNRKQFPIQSIQFFMQIGIAAILMVLFSPIAYFHHIIWLYPFILMYGLYLVLIQPKFKYLFITIYCILLFFINIDFTSKYYTWSLIKLIPMYLPLNTIGLGILALMMAVSLKYNNLLAVK